jgi:hypothetical protein
VPGLPTPPAQYAPRRGAYALVELGDSEAIDLFLQEEDARRALAEMLLDEPNWAASSTSSRWSWTNATLPRTNEWREGPWALPLPTQSPRAGAHTLGDAKKSYGSLWRTSSGAPCG